MIFVRTCNAQSSPCPAYPHGLAPHIQMFSTHFFSKCSRSMVSSGQEVSPCAARERTAAWDLMILSTERFALCGQSSAPFLFARTYGSASLHAKLEPFPFYTSHHLFYACFSSRYCPRLSRQTPCAVLFHAAACCLCLQRNITESAPQALPFQSLRRAWAAWDIPGAVPEGAPARACPARRPDETPPRAAVPRA